MRTGFDVEGVTEAQRAFDAIGLRAARPASAFDAIEDDFTHRIARRAFDTEGASGTRHWPALVDETIERKRREGVDHGVLQASGRLRRSAEGGAGAVIEQTPHGITFRTLVGYAGFHQHGTRRMPQRAVVVTERDQQVWAGWIGDYVVAGRVGGRP